MLLLCLSHIYRGILHYLRYFVFRNVFHDYIPLLWAVYVVGDSAAMAWIKLTVRKEGEKSPWTPVKLNCAERYGRSMCTESAQRGIFMCACLALTGRNPLKSLPNNLWQGTVRIAASSSVCSTCLSETLSATIETEKTWGERRGKRRKTQTRKQIHFYYSYNK